MPFVLLDDGYHSNRKVKAAGIPAAGIYAIALSYCGDEVTDGYIPRWWLEGRAGRYKRHLKDLVDNSLMHEIEPGNTLEIVDKSGNIITISPPEKGYFIPDFVQHNLSSIEVAARRREKSQAGKKGAVKRWGHSSSHTNRQSTSDNGSHSTSDTTDDGYARGYAPPAPSPREERESLSSTTARDLSNNDPDHGSPAGMDERARRIAWQARAAAPDVRSPGAFIRSGMASGAWPDPPPQDARPVNMPPSDPAAAIAALIRNGVIRERFELDEELARAGLGAGEAGSLVAQFDLARQLDESEEEA